MVFRRNYRRNYGGVRRNKRWYFNAGANLPFIGKTKIAFGTRKRALNRQIRNVVRRQLEEPKIKTYANSGVGVNAGHIYNMNLLGNIGVGDGTQFDREADNIFVDSAKFTFYLNNAGTFDEAIVKPTEYRIMIVKHDVEVSAGNDVWGTDQFVNSDLFKISESGTSTAANSPTQGLIDPKKVTCLFDKIYSIRPSFSGEILNKTISFSVPIKQRFVYKTGSNYGKWSNLYLLIMGNHYGAAVDTLLSGAIYMSGQVYFKDK